MSSISVGRGLDVSRSSAFGALRRVGNPFAAGCERIYYNLSTMSLSIFVAFAISTVEIVGLVIDETGLSGQPWDLIARIDINLGGRIIVGVLLAVWIGAILNEKLRRLDQRYGDGTREVTEP